MYTNLGTKKYHRILFFYQAVMLSILFLDLEFQKILSKIDFPFKHTCFVKKHFFKV